MTSIFLLIACDTLFSRYIALQSLPKCFFLVVLGGSRARVCYYYTTSKLQNLVMLAYLFTECCLLIMYVACGCYVSHIVMHLYALKDFNTMYTKWLIDQVELCHTCTMPLLTRTADILIIAVVHIMQY